MQPHPTWKKHALRSVLLMLALATGACGTKSGTDGTGAAVDAQTADASIGCTTDAQCDDNDPCTDDTCRADGTCKHAVLASNCSDAAGDGPEKPADVDVAIQQDIDVDAGTDALDAIGVDAEVKADGGGDSGPTECKVDADCTDDNVCTADSCAGGVCKHQNISGQCSTGIPCSAGDQCQDGKCVYIACDGSPPSDVDANDSEVASADGGTDASLDGEVQPDVQVSGTDAVAADDADAAPDQDAPDALDSADSVDADSDVSLCDPSTCAAKTAGNPCQTSSCVAGACLTANVDGPCDDGIACSVGDACASGVCQPGTAATCDDSNPCTDDTCDLKLDCQHAPNVLPCNDGNPCTQTDVCNAGACSGGNPVICSALDQCHTSGVCDPANGKCTDPAVPDGLACTDQNGCTLKDACQSGICVGADAVTCSASDQCHDAGTCDTSTGNCSNPPSADGLGCNDANACTTLDTCQSGTCKGSEPILCTPLDQCHVAGQCNPATGSCSDPAATSGTKCTDGDACSQTDSCQNGACVGANVVVCTALDQCHTVGTCDGVSGACSNPAVQDGVTCSDGDACTQTDTCQSGTCTGANAVSCAASDGCHVAGVCSKADGSCSNPAATDGTVCTDPCAQSGTCTSGKCKALSACLVAKASSGDAQSGNVGTVLGKQLVVAVTDGLGAAAPGIVVSFTASGDASLVPSKVTTDASGHAAAWFRLGTVSGTYTTTAAVSGVATPITFKATATAAPVARLEVASGAAQSAEVGQPLANPIVARATDLYGNPVAGVAVTFLPVLAGDTITSTPLQTTDGYGLAQGSAKLGNAAGARVFRASSSGLSGSPVDFPAIGTASVAYQLTKVYGDGQGVLPGEALPIPLTVQVLDAHGNGKSGVSVAFAASSGGGSVDVSPVISDANGFASAPVHLGSTPGTQQFTASVAGLVGSPLTFIATAANPGAAFALQQIIDASGSVIQGDGQTGYVGTTLAVPMVVLVTDANNIGVGGISVTFAAAGAAAQYSGGVGQKTVVTDGSGRASTTMLLRTLPGTGLQYTATVAGLAGSPATFTEAAIAGPAANLAAYSGQSQSGAAGTTLGNNLVFKVTDPYANAVAGIPVTFTAMSGSQSHVLPSSGVSNASGQVSTAGSLGTLVGTYKFQAASAGLLGSPATISATAVPAAPAIVSITSGDNQVLPVNATAPLPLVATVYDVFGNLVPQASLHAVSITPGTVISPTNVIATDLATASFTVTASHATGANQVGVEATGNPSTLGVATMLAQAPDQNWAPAGFLDLARSGSVASVDTNLDQIVVFGGFLTNGTRDNTTYLLNLPGVGNDAQVAISPAASDCSTVQNATTAVSPSAQLAGTTVGMGDGFTLSCASMTFAPDVVFKVTVNGSALCSFQASGFDTVLALRSGTCSSGTQWACNDDAAAPGASGSNITQTLTTGDYYLLLDGYAAAQGDYTLNVTCTSTNSAWTAASPSASPSGLAEHAQAYDPTRKQTVLYGGSDGANTLTDHWEFDGSTWKLRVLSLRPSARRGAAMAFDPISQKVLLFGGTTSATTSALVNDTWAYPGSVTTQWAALTPVNKPAPRSNAAMALDWTRQRIVLFGGQGASGLLGDTWEWDGLTWTPVTFPAQMALPAARKDAVLVWDGNAQRLVLQGGNGGETGNDTWEYDGKQWFRRNPARLPNAKSQMMAAWDPIGQRVVMFGGSSGPAGWEYKAGILGGGGTATGTSAPVYISAVADTWATTGAATTAVTPAGYSFSDNTAGYKDDFATACGYNSGQPDTVRRLDVLRAASCTITASNSSMEPVIDLVDANLKLVGCNGTGTTTTSLTAVLAPGTYYLVLDGYYSGSGYISASISCSEVSQAAASVTMTGSAPQCSTLASQSTIPIAPSATMWGTTTGMGDDVAGACGYNSGQPDAIYRVDVISPSVCTFAAKSSGTLTPVVDLSSGSCGNQSLWTCDANSNSSGTASLTAALPAGSYFLTVDAYYSGAGEYSLSASCKDLAPQSAKVTIATGAATCGKLLSGGAIIPIIGPLTLTGDTSGMGDDIQTSCGYNSGQQDVVYELSALQQATCTVQVTSSTITPVIGFSSGSCSGGSVSCSGGSGLPTATMTQTLPAGKSYFYVDSYYSGQGPYTFAITCQ